MKIAANCPWCGKESKAELFGVAGFAPSMMDRDSVELGCEHGVEVRNGTVFFSTVIFRKDGEIQTIPAEPVEMAKPK